MQRDGTQNIKAACQISTPVLAPTGHDPLRHFGDSEYALAGAFWSVLLARAEAVQGYDLLVAENGCRPSLEEIGSVEADRVRAVKRR